MKYFRYECLRADTIYSPTDEQGRAVDVLYGESGEELFGYRPVSSLQEALLTVKHARELRDRMYCPSSYLLVSERLGAALRAAAIDEAIAFLPVTVVGIAQPARYLMLHCPVAHDPFDYERSSFEYFHSQPDAIQSVRKYVFDPHKLPPWELFRTPQYDWIMTESLVQHLLAQNFTGHSFHEIWSNEASASE